MQKIEIGYGIWLYENVFPKSLNLIERVEDTIEKSNGLYSWKEAMVGWKKKVPEYRNCLDFKISKSNNISIIKNKSSLKAQSIWQDSYDAQKECLDDYSKMYNIKLNYWEAFNFVKYTDGHHFEEHSDHGDAYVCTVSGVGYLNDDYEGGELFFPKLNIYIKPKAGQLYLFPSSFIYSHKSMPIKSGIKYSLVTMFDYNDKHHKGV